MLNGSRRQESNCKNSMGQQFKLDWGMSIRHQRLLSYLEPKTKRIAPLSDSMEILALMYLSRESGMKWGQQGRFHHYLHDFPRLNSNLDFSFLLFNPIFIFPLLIIFVLHRRSLAALAHCTLLGWTSLRLCKLAYPTSLLLILGPSMLPPPWCLTPPLAPPGPPLLPQRFLPRW